ncbi:MAG: MFS transporter [Micrococcales bacterium]
MQNSKSRWFGLVFISMAISLVIIDGTIVNTIFPSLSQSLSLTDTDVQWVQESYVLVFASMLLVWGSLADRFGRRAMLVLGLVIFVAASIWAGLSHEAWTLILARVAQGVGGAMVLPTTLSLVNANFVGKERGIAFAVWGATIGGMVAVGPVLGGWLTTVSWKLTLFSTVISTWRWAFWVNLPFGLIVVIGLLLLVKESKQEQRAGGIDWLGALLAALGFFTLTFGLIEGRSLGWWAQGKALKIGNYTWPSDSISIIPIILMLSLVLFFVFIKWEQVRDKAHKNVLLDLNLFKISSFRNGSIAALIISMGEFGLIFAIPLWLQNITGLNAFNSGMVLLWLAGGAFIGSGAVGGLSGKLSPVMAVRLGVLLEIVGIVGLGIFANSDKGWGSIAAWLCVYGLGVGIATAQLTGVIMQDVPLEKVGQGSGTQSTARQVGSALGIAVLGTVLFTGITAHTSSQITGMAEFNSYPKSQVQQLGDKVGQIVSTSQGGVVPSLSMLLQYEGVPQQFADPMQSAAQRGFTDAVKTTAYAAAGFLAIGLAATYTIQGRRPEDELVVEGVDLNKDEPQRDPDLYDTTDPAEQD